MTTPRFTTRLFNALLGRIILPCAEKIICRVSATGRARYFLATDFPWTEKLEQNTPLICSELGPLLSNLEQVPAFHEVSELQRPISDDDRWKTFVLQVFGTPIEKNCTQCPNTAAALISIPGLQNAMFSILAPHKTIPEHRGPYNGLLRYHLALVVPENTEQCAVWVGGERRTWSEGKSLILDDSYLHHVENNTDQTRVVLFADFERPLAWPWSWMNRAVIALIKKTELAQQPLTKLRNRDT